MHFSRQLEQMPDVRNTLRPFLLSHGFESTGDLQFKRSTRLRTMVALDPSRWQVTVEIDPVMKRLEMTVATDGQIVTPRERAYFSALFAELTTLSSTDASRATALTLRGDDMLSERAAQAALNENVAVTFAFFMSLPIQVGVLHFALAIPMFWSIIWASVGSIAIAYAVLFSVKNRAPTQRPSK